MEFKDLGRLEILRRKNSDPLWMNGDLYRLMYKTDLYVVAYERLKSNPGNMTPGPDGSTLDGFSMKSIEDIVNQMRDESFQFSRARRVHIPKEKGGTRPLGIAPPRDKVVQEVMRMILEAIYDSPHGSSFAESSHGFRPGRGPHTALKAIRHQWSGVSWIVEGDVKAAFDNIDHDLLIAILRKRVSDERFLRLIRKALTCGYYEFKVPVNSVIGTPQGSVLSPILCNVFLDELDQFCQGLVRTHERGETRKLNPDYRRVQRKIEYQRRRIPKVDDPNERRARVAHLRRLQKDLVTIPSAACDEDYIRVKYVRYADDWCLGINGPKELAEQLRNEIADFMHSRLALTLNVEKTFIRHAKTEEAFFLGTRLRIGSDSQRKTRVKLGGRTFVRRTTGWTPVMMAPLKSQVARLYSDGFCDANGFPTPKSAWANLDDDQIVSKFNGVLRGILNYYCFVDNYAELRRVQYILQHSAAKTLATKHRRSTRAVFKKHGKTLNVVATTSRGKEMVTSLKLEKSWSSEPNRFLGGDILDPGHAIQFHFKLRSRSKLGEHCAVCDDAEDVVMHHVRHVRKMGKKVRGFDRILASLNRKQLPVCRRCHAKIHGGKYDGVSLRDLANLSVAAR
jgi:group II intron reverse transcriptase/maturase